MQFVIVAQEDLVPVARELGIGFLAYSPLGRGLLTGALKTRSDIPGQQAAFNPRVAEENFDKVCAYCGSRALLLAQEQCNMFLSAFWQK